MCGALCAWAAQISDTFGLLIPLPTVGGIDNALRLLLHGRIVFPYEAVKIEFFLQGGVEGGGIHQRYRGRSGNVLRYR